MSGEQNIPDKFREAYDNAFGQADEDKDGIIKGSKVEEVFNNATKNAGEDAENFKDKMYAFYEETRGKYDEDYKKDDLWFQFQKKVGWK